MERASDLHQSLNSVSSIVEASVAETDIQIASLHQVIRSLVSPQEFEKLSKAEPAKFADEIHNEDELIYALEKQRLDLVMEIQEQNFATKKLQEMVGECEELVHAVTEYYRNTNTQEAPPPHLHKVSNESAVQVKEVLGSNVEELRNSSKAILANVASALRGIQTSEAKVDSAEFQTKVNESIDALNRVFESYPNVERQDRCEKS